ncbi:hypothetical protein DICPUDRAFT_150728 [Dictyostelium purpureum]|uniref:Uncharacterized protein n=1 Tax=Dictyostelium purpureum TaxID=5786 RepID=F0ZH36_DICPU|nr:uncharacterized protein DICPUDRAFT_150728 [Dictyostelium purpureum]EGC36705.1 hypothetical protein DICPUDRAFT_150728 [Dictyostelium purpureum]|eukprot:XP_003286730.1 hypothetical protein DICPUDRAFT_150728 [Dictyostelium purpureum]
MSFSDRVLIIGPAVQPGENSTYREAEVTKEITLRSNNGNKKFPLYTLPKRLGICVSIELNNNYSIRVTSYEIDGKPKTYYNLNVPFSSFNYVYSEKINVFSKHGYHVVKKKFITESNISSIQWYFSVLSIYIDFFLELLKTSPHYEKENKQMGFDNFKIIPGFRPI